MNKAKEHLERIFPDSDIVSLLDGTARAYVSTIGPQQIVELAAIENHHADLKGSSLSAGVCKPNGSVVITLKPKTSSTKVTCPYCHGTGCRDGAVGVGRPSCSYCEATGKITKL